MNAPINNAPEGARGVPLQVGDRAIWPPVLLAPMAALTNVAMRTLCEEHGCGASVTEFIPAAALATKRPRALQMITPSAEGRPFGVQIYGRVPTQIAKAAALVAQVEPTFIDLNMGCPTKKVTRGVSGAALMREPALSAELVEAAREAAAPIPVTVKMRTGWDATSINAPELAAKMVQAGAALVTVHGRTREQRYSGTVDLQTIAEVKAAVEVPVIANGDIVDMASMQRALEQTGADGVMIGRAAIGNPWIFAEASAWFEGRPFSEPNRQERLASYLRHLELYRQRTAEDRAVFEMRKFAQTYLAPLPDGDLLCQQVMKLTLLDDVCGLLHAASELSEAQLLQ